MKFASKDMVDEEEDEEVVGMVVAGVLAGVGADKEGVADVDDDDDDDGRGSMLTFCGSERDSD